MRSLFKWKPRVKLPAGQDLLEYFVNGALFVLTAWLIYNLIATNIVSSTFFQRLMRVQNAWVVFLLLGICGSSFLGMIGYFIRGKEIKLSFMGNDIKVRIPKSAEPYIFKAPLLAVFGVFVLSGSWPAYLLLQPDCSQPVVAFHLGGKVGSDPHYAREVIDVERGRNISILAEITGNNASNVVCSWLVEGEAVEKANANTNTGCTIYLSTGSQPGLGVVTLEAAAPLCRSRQIVPLVVRVK